MVRFAWLVLALAVVARAETFDLRERGRLEVFVAGEWKLAGEDLGDRYEIVIVPRGEGNAFGRLVVNLMEKDEFASPSRLRQRVIELVQPLADKLGVRRPEPDKFYSRQGFGFYCTLIDPELVGKPPQRGNMKYATYGVVRLAPRIYVAVTILADDPGGPLQQALLGAVEGMELRAPR